MFTLLLAWATCCPISWVTSDFKLLTCMSHCCNAFLFISGAFAHVMCYVVDSCPVARELHRNGVSPPPPPPWLATRRWQRKPEISMIACKTNDDHPTRTWFEVNWPSKKTKFSWIPSVMKTLFSNKFKVAHELFLYVFSTRSDLFCLSIDFISEWYIGI